MNKLDEEIDESNQDTGEFVVDFGQRYYSSFEEDDINVTLPVEEPTENKAKEASNNKETSNRGDNVLLLDHVIELKLQLAQKQSIIDEISSKNNRVVLENEHKMKRLEDDNISLRRENKDLRAQLEKMAAMLASEKKGKESQPKETHCENNDCQKEFLADRSFCSRTTASLSKSFVSKTSERRHSVGGTTTPLSLSVASIKTADRRPSLKDFDISSIQEEEINQEPNSSTSPTWQEEQANNARRPAAPSNSFSENLSNFIQKTRPGSTVNSSNCLEMLRDWGENDDDIESVNDDGSDPKNRMWFLRRASLAI